MSSSSFKSLARAPARLASSADVKKAFIWLGGYLLTGCIPSRLDRDAYERFSGHKHIQHLFRRQVGLTTIRERMRDLLGQHLSESAVNAAADEYFEMRFEELWGRWRASHGADWFVRTEVEGLNHLADSLNHGHGVVFWGMSFCRALFPKIALSRSGINLVQLSAPEHGTDYPLTMLGKYLAGPLYCRPENAYLRKRIQISVDGSPGYKEQLADVLRNKGCIWIAAETTRARRPIAAELFSRRALIPAGAPALALKQRATLIPVHTRREAPFHYRVILQPPIHLDRTVAAEKCLTRAVEEFAGRLADLILEKPSDWSWEAKWVSSLLK